MKESKLVTKSNGVNFFTDEKEKLDRTEKRGRIRYYIIKKFNNLRDNYNNIRTIW